MRMVTGRPQRPQLEAARRVSGPSGNGFGRIGEMTSIGSDFQAGTPGRARWALLGLVLLGGLLLAARGGSPGLAGAAPADKPATRPNVVVIMSDDQTQDSIRYMDRTLRLIGERGATFPTTVTNWPLCCPSRATFLTGRYAHNHGVLGNRPPLGGFDRLDSSETLPVWLQRAGYFTAHIGKYLNGYEASDVTVPPGWSEWHGSKSTYRFYGYRLLEDGQINTYGSAEEDPDAPAAPETYSTDVYTDKAVELITRRAPEDDPFFLSLAYLAPHAGGPNNRPTEPQGRCEETAKPAIRHKGTFDAEPLPRPPSFNEADVSDKPEAISARPPLTPARVARLTRNYRCRGESLASIDDGVARVIEALRATGELRDTLVIYTSDNGFFHGEHRLESGKNRVYEEAIRVPLLIRGPGIPKGVSVDDLAINADLAPTILDATGATTPISQDGRSLLPFAKNPDRFHGRELLIEQQSPDGDDGEPTGVEYAAVRTSKYVYVENATGELELYDLEADPFQLTNQAANPSFAEPRAALAGRLARLRSCAGKSCRTKPALKLKLPRETRKDGRRCTPAGDFLVRVRNNAASRLVGVEFAVAGRPAGRETEEPFERRLRARLLRRKAKPEITAVAELVDGRILTLRDRIPICR